MAKQKSGPPAAGKDKKVSKKTNGQGGRLDIEAPHAEIAQQVITDTLELNFMPYAMSVIVSRAIPEIDGFKPSHRKLLYTMYKMGLLTGARTKSANIVGQTMKLNPHGDQAIYETMVRLTRSNASLLHPYVDSKGNFGKQYSRDMQHAAARYTEARLDKLCEELFRNIDHDTVEFVDNYDGTMKEPTLLPATFPSVLVNQNQGIAVGMASNIAPFNLREVCAATKQYIDDPGADLQEIMPAPDFPGGAMLIYDEDHARQTLKTGRGTFKMRAVYHVDRKSNMIEITEIPYPTTVEQIMDDVTNLVKNGKIKEVADMRDETDLDGMRLTIDYKRSTDPDALMTKLFMMTNLECGFSCNFNILVNGTPRVMGVKQILGEWLSFRRTCVRREIAFDLQRKQDRLHLLEGLEKILLDIDKAIAIIRTTEKEVDVVPNLCQGFSIDEIQADYVAEIKLRNLNRQYILNRVADIKKLKTDIRDLKKLLGDSRLIDERIKSDLDRVSEKYGQDRRTKLIHEGKIERITKEDLIPDYRLRFFLTNENYLKKLAFTSLRSAGDLKTKDGDYIIQDVEGTNKDELLLFSNRANLYKYQIHEISDHKPSEFGEYLTNLLELDEDEKIVQIQIAGEYDGEMIFAFENGKCARVDMQAYVTKTKRRKLVNAYSAKSALIGLYYQREPEDFLLKSSDGKVCLFDSSLVPKLASRSNQGIQILRLNAKRGQKLESFKRSGSVSLNDIERYRIRTLPGRGLFLKEELLDTRQLDLGEVID